MKPEEPLHGALGKEFSLAGRVAVVTGAASGIGRETACVLALAGARVVAADINESGLAATAELIASSGGTALTQKTDVSRKADVDALAKRAIRDLGGLDIWVNAAGIIMRVPIVEAEEADLDRVIATNLKSAYWGTAAAGRAMMGKGSGAIVNISSVGGESPGPLISFYSLTKAGVNMLTRTAAVEFGPSGIRVNAVAPGWVDTPMGNATFVDENGELDPRKVEEGMRVRLQASPLGIAGTPHDIAMAVLYLASDASRFVTGQIFRPNGGVTMP